MLILWQDRVAAEAHAEAVASAVVLLAVHTAAASEAHITVAHSVVITQDISQVSITIITDLISITHSDRDAEQSFTAVVAVQ